VSEQTGLRVVGAGLGRTATMSLKAALEQLLGGRCYHMFEVREPDTIDRWRRVAGGETGLLEEIMAGYTATVDWPAASFWRELAEANPDAVILLSTRRSAEEWWRSASRTIFLRTQQDDISQEFRDMWGAITASRFTPDWLDADAAMAAYERHNAEVRALAPPERLVDWQPGDGWAPICAALGVPQPVHPFPESNSSGEFRERTGLDGPDAGRA
jgi:Sulfotransferase domain